MNARWARVAGPIAITTIAVGCAGVIGVDSERFVAPADLQSSGDSGADEATTSNEAPATGNWQCLDAPLPPTPAGNVEVTLQVYDLATKDKQGRTGTPVVGFPVRVCNGYDFACEHPLATQTTDSAGSAVLGVPGGFSGFYELAANGYAPTLVSRPPALTASRYSVPVGKKVFFDLSASLAGIAVDDGRGMIILSIYDCVGLPASGVAFDAPAGTAQLLYVIDGLPSRAGTSTDPSGAAVVVNADPGVFTTTARRGDRVFRTMSTIVRAGWVTMVDMRPDQAASPADESK